DMAAYAPDLELEQRVELLEAIDVETRLELALAWARETLAELELKDRIRSEVSDGLDQQQREMLLRRQMDAIRKELGESDDDAVAEYRARADALDLPDTVRTAVNKTSLGESVARALGRPFVRIAVGGVRDEAEIRGHRRTYVGARAGRIVRALTEAKAMNPVVLIDEVDKLQAGGWSGDPSSAL